jgi:hypothetical protein
MTTGTATLDLSADAAVEVVNCIEETKAGETFVSDGKTWQRRQFRGRLEAATCGLWSVVQQNPHTSSRWAAMARRGVPIYWAIQGETYRYRIIAVDANTWECVDC